MFFFFGGEMAGAKNVTTLAARLTFFFSWYYGFLGLICRDTTWFCQIAMFISYDISGDTLHLVSMATFKFVFPLADDDICPYCLPPPSLFPFRKKGSFPYLGFLSSIFLSRLWMYEWLGNWKGIFFAFESCRVYRKMPCKQQQLQVFLTTSEDAQSLQLLLV